MSRVVSFAFNALLASASPIAALALPAAAAPADKRIAQAPQTTQAKPAPPVPGKLPNNPSITWQADADVLIKLGDNEILKRNYEKAVAAYGEAIEVEPKSWKAHLGRAKAYVAMKNDDNALIDFEAVIGLNPGAADAYIGRGRILGSKNYWDKALDDFKKGIELDPNNAQGYSLRGLVHMRSYGIIFADLLGAATFKTIQVPGQAAPPKRWDELMAAFRDKDSARLLKPYQQLAIADFDKAISLDPNGAVHYLYRGKAYLVAERTDDVADLARSVAAEMTKNIGAPFGLVPDTRHAIADFTKAISLDPKNAEAWRDRAWAHFKAGRPAEGLPDAEHAVALTPKNARAIETRGVIYEALGKKKEAIADYREALRINGDKDSLNKTRLDRIDPTQRVADACTKARGDDVIAACSRLLALDPNNAKAWFNRGKAHKGQGYKNTDNYDRAIADFSQAIKLDSNYADAYKERGQAYEMKRDYDRAIADYGEKIKRTPKDAWAYKYRGKVYLDRGDYDRAIADYGQAIRLNPEDGSAYTDRGDAYFKKGAYDPAIADYGEAIALNPEGYVPYDKRGDVYLRNGDYDRAIADYGQMIALNAKRNFGFDNTYYSRGTAHLRKGDYDRAIADFDRVIAQRSFNAGAYISRGDAYSAKGDYDRAVADYSQGISLEPQNAVAYNNRAALRYVKGEYDRAFTDADEAVRLDPKSAAARDTRGEAYIGKGDYDRAIADLDQSIALDPKIAVSYSDRGYAYGRRDRSGDRERAVADLDKGIALDPRFARGYAYRAAIHVLRGDPDRAIADAGEAIRLDPKDAFAYGWRGKAYEDKGDHEHAQADYDMAQKLNPALEEARRNSGRAPTASTAPAAAPQSPRPLQAAGLPAEPIPPKRTACTVWRSDAYVYVKLGDIERSKNSRDKAAAAYAEAHNIRGYAHLIKGEYDRAFADADEAVRLDPKNADAWRTRGEVSIGRSNYDRAIADLSEAIKLDPKTAESYGDRGYAYGRRGRAGDRDRAMADLDKGISLNPRFARGYAYRAAIQEQHGDPDRAIADAGEALRLDPRDPFAYGWRGKAYDDKGEHERALADYDAATKLNPVEDKAHCERGRPPFASPQYPQRPQTAAAAAEPVPPGAPLNGERRAEADANVKLGDAERSKNNFDKAVDYYNQAIGADPRNAQAFAGRGFAYTNLGYDDRAWSDFNTAIRLAPSLAAGWRGRGVIWGRKFYWDEALEDLSRSVELDPGNGIAHEARSVVYVRSLSIVLADLSGSVSIRGLGERIKAVGEPGKPTEAGSGKTYEDYVAELMTSAKTAQLLVPYRELALADLDKAIEINPGRANAYKIRGDLWLVTSRGHDAADLAASLENEMKKDIGSAFGLVPDFERAIADFSKVIELDPKNSESYRGRAWAYFKSGRPAEGLPDAERAVELAPNDKDGFETRGLIHEALGHKSDAAADYRKAMTLPGGNGELNKKRLHRLGTDL